MTMTVVDCLSLGPPRIGKTCAKDRLAGKWPKGNPATLKDGIVVYPREISMSTGVADSVLKMAVEVKQGKQQWVPRTLDQEVMSFVKRVDSSDPVQTSELSNSPVPTQPHDVTKTHEMLSNTQAHAHGISSAVFSSSQEKCASLSPSDAVQLSSSAAVASVISDKTTLVPPNFITDALRRNWSSQELALTDESFMIHFADTGGQGEFHEVLPALVSGPCMFLLCFSLHAGLNQRYNICYDTQTNISTVNESSYTVNESSYTVKDEILQCLTTVYCIGSQRRIDGKMKQVKPKVFFIGTQDDLVNKEKVEEIDLELQQAIQHRKELSSLVEYRTTYPPRLIFTVNNYDKEDDKFQTIREAVHAVAEREKEMYRVSLPFSIATLDFYLRQPTNENPLTEQEVDSIAKKHGVSSTMIEQHISSLLQNTESGHGKLCQKIDLTDPKLLAEAIHLSFDHSEDTSVSEDELDNEASGSASVYGQPLEEVATDEPESEINSKSKVKHLANRGVKKLFQPIQQVGRLFRRKRTTDREAEVHQAVSFSEASPTLNWRVDSSDSATAAFSTTVESSSKKAKCILEAIKELNDRCHARVPVLSMDEFVGIAKKCNISQDEIQDALWSLQYLLGTIRHFPESEELKDIVFNNSQFYSDVFTKVITSTFNVEQNRGLLSPKAFANFHKKGVFTLEDLDKVWFREKQYLSSKQLVALLLHLNILAPLDYDGKSGYFLPCALNHADFPVTSLQFPFDSFVESQPPLLVSFKCGFIPKGIFSGLVAYLIQHAEENGLPLKLIRVLLYRDQVSLWVNSIVFLTIKNTPTFIRFSLHFHPIQSIERCTPPLVLKVIESGLKVVASRLNYTVRLVPKLGFECTCKMQDQIHFTEYQLAKPSFQPYCTLSDYHCTLPENYSQWFEGMRNISCTCSASLYMHFFLRLSDYTI